MRRPVSDGMRYAPKERRAQGAKKRRPAMKKNSTVATSRKQIFKEKKLTIGMDLGDQSTYYCVLDEAGEVILEQKLPTTKQAMKQVFGRIPRSRVALETGGPFRVGQPAVDPVGARSDRGPCAEGATDRGK
jgi:activator of 2-hydroxyglutaryl-CoA dehydratase